MAIDTETSKASAAMADANVLHSPSSAYAQERVKWESNYTTLGAPGRLYVKRLYPMMIYLGGRPEGGLGADTVIAYETINSERELDAWKQRGYRESPADAVAAYQAQELEFAKLAAEQNYDVKHKLSPAAGAEVEAAQQAVSGHLPVVPVTGIKPRARKDGE